MIFIQLNRDPLFKWVFTNGVITGSRALHLHGVWNGYNDIDVVLSENLRHKLEQFIDNSQGVWTLDNCQLSYKGSKVFDLIWVSNVGKKRPPVTTTLRGYKVLALPDLLWAYKNQDRGETDAEKIKAIEEALKQNISLSSPVSPPASTSARGRLSFGDSPTENTPARGRLSFGGLPSQASLVRRLW